MSPVSLYFRTRALHITTDIKGCTHAQVVATGGSVTGAQSLYKVALLSKGKEGQSSPPATPPAAKKKLFTYAPNMHNPTVQLAAVASWAQQAQALARAQAQERRARLGQRRETRRLQAGVAAVRGVQREHRAAEQEAQDEAAHEHIAEERAPGLSGAPALPAALRRQPLPPPRQHALHHLLRAVRWERVRSSAHPLIRPLPLSALST